MVKRSEICWYGFCVVLCQLRGVRERILCVQEMEMNNNRHTNSPTHAASSHQFWRHVEGFEQNGVRCNTIHITWFWFSCNLCEWKRYRWTNGIRFRHVHCTQTQRHDKNNIYFKGGLYCQYVCLCLCVPSNAVDSRSLRVYMLDKSLYDVNDATDCCRETTTVYTIFLLSWAIVYPAPLLELWWCSSFGRSVVHLSNHIQPRYIRLHFSRCCCMVTWCARVGCCVAAHTLTHRV